ncbi:S41 family peptidase [Octadecabacter sp. R77987]|uniref:S41 family peptidase n=1 Tax=Octadecabacter sp. R77987 TaxID=3093874 RepID=UPI00367239F9
MIKRALNWAFWGIGTLVALVALSWPVFMPDRAARGLWATDGYGLVLDIGPFGLNVYEVNSATCLLYLSGPAHSLALRALADADFSANDGVLTINVQGTINPITATPIAALPDHCGTTPQPGTPRENFDALWTVMNENYAFFDLHGVDWAARYDQFAPQFTDDLDLAATFDLMTQVLSPLDDGHTYIISQSLSRGFSPATHVDWAEERSEFLDVARARGLNSVENTGLEYAILEGNIGYVLIRHMGANPGLLGSEDGLAGDGFAEVALALENTDAIVIDARLNPGGSDGVGLAYGAFFATEPVLCCTKVTRTASGYSDPFTITVTPAGPRALTQPVILLTSGYTASAAEIFTMAMRELPQVTVVGEPTAGGHSDIMEAQLPNGFVLGFSHQRYFAADGSLFERVGVPPDVVSPFNVAAMLAGDDPQLDAVLTDLRN